MGGITQRPWTPTKRRGPIAAEFSGPGPAWVTLPGLIGRKPYVSGKSTSPCFTFGNRHGDTTDYAGPGPGTYNVMGLSSRGKSSAPSASMHYRHAEPKSFVTPAPGAYCPEKAEAKILDHSPKYSFGLKPKAEIKSNTPAPNVYNVPSVLGNGNCREGTKQKAPAYTMSGRGKEIVDSRVTNPGPGKYESGSLNAMKEKAPAYSLSIRTQLPSDDTKKPGPGAHSPEKVNMSPAPAHTFGIKHSPYTANLKSI
ncbi:outer dense fiber protein 3 isoform X1 [Folsomia candida]|uniref:Outer dense fiber protein 3 n=1 Tax=Folsomia candida TaxID=158441 RepID=A0A226E7J1_FOLCA|nr:outer dense fiber protein 3 isoform X1 [Folsomia candida]XP_035708938.1 outer dense fiber protein 3 isoform X1 [Folsomia candida]OXA52917.1 Outer dense fiber protein 3 [Folsomia candida]